MYEFKRAQASKLASNQRVELSCGIPRNNNNFDPIIQCAMLMNRVSIIVVVVVGVVVATLLAPK